MTDEEKAERKKRRTYYPAGGFSQNLHTFMLEKGMTQAMFTQAINNVRDSKTPEYGRFRVSAWLRGKNRPNPIALNDIAKVLDVPSTKLMPPSDATFVGLDPNAQVDESTTLPSGMVKWKFSGVISPTKHLKILTILRSPTE